MGQSVAARPTARKRSQRADAVDFYAFETACGWMGLAGKNQTVHQLRLGYADPDELREESSSILGEFTEADWFPELREKLQAYAAGQRVSFAKIRCALPRLTDFQQQVIEFVRKIPYGDVLSYGEVAAQVGYPGAARAVGTVMSTNRIPLIIPCHRVVAAGGKLGGYTSPRGVTLKQWLLDLEQAGRPNRPR